MFIEEDWFDVKLKEYLQRSSVHTIHEKPVKS